MSAPAGVADVDAVEGVGVLVLRRPAIGQDPAAARPVRIEVDARGRRDDLVVVARDRLLLEVLLAEVRRDAVGDDADDGGLGRDRDAGRHLRERHREVDRDGLTQRDADAIRASRLEAGERRLDRVLPGGERREAIDAAAVGHGGHLPGHQRLRRGRHRHAGKDAALGVLHDPLDASAGRPLRCRGRGENGENGDADQRRPDRDPLLPVHSISSYGRGLETTTPWRPGARTDQDDEAGRRPGVDHDAAPRIAVIRAAAADST